MRPLLDLTKKNLPWNWSPSCQTSFDSLKRLFLSKPVLHLPDLSAPFAVATDASKHASGAILLQTDSNGDWHPCSYLSQSFSPAKRNYDIYNCELLAIIHALKSWHHYLHGSPFPMQVLTNHKNLTYFRQPQALNRHQARWLIDLADSDLKMVHVPGKLLAGPDALSRRPDLLPTDDSDNTNVTLLPPSLFVNLINTALSHRIKSASTGDPLVLQALQSMHEDIPLPFRSWLADWQVEAGILTYKGHVYVPTDNSLHCAILECCHDHESARHPGFLKSRQLVTAEFWWPGLASFVRHYVEGCALCQQNKVNTHPTIPPLSPIKSTASRPFQQISCDLITDLPVSSGFNSLLVVVDHGLTKGVILCPTKKSITAEGIASLFFHKVFLRFGLFDKVISDRGPQFASSFTQELGKLLHYDLSLSTAYHPQSDGETERVNQEVETYLRIFCGNDPISWSESIPHAEFTHNHRPHSVTNQSPFYLMMGYEPRALPSVISDTSIPAVETRLIINPKFAPKREGPFTITKVLSPIIYQLRLPKTWKIHPVFHTSLLSPYRENEVHGKNFPVPPPDLINGEEEYEIEQIIRHHGAPSSHSFLIRWKGYSAEEDSWVPERDLKNAKSALALYKKLHPSVFRPQPLSH